MTEKEIISHFQVRIVDFDGELIPDELGFYEKETNTAFLSNKLSKKERIKVLLHELGHKDHTRSEYQNARLRCENEYDPSPRHCWFSSFNYRYCGFNFCYPSSKIKKSPH